MKNENKIIKERTKILTDGARNKMIEELGWDK